MWSQDPVDPVLMDQRCLLINDRADRLPHSTTGVLVVTEERASKAS